MGTPSLPPQAAMILGLTKKDVVIVICGSGVRAPKAVNALAKAGYTNAYSVIDGYKGWQEAKLPWSRKLDRVRMYTNSLAVQ